MVAPLSALLYETTFSLEKTVAKNREALYHYNAVKCCIYEVIRVLESASMMVALTDALSLFLSLCIIRLTETDGDNFGIRRNAHACFVYGGHKLPLV